VTDRGAIDLIREQWDALYHYLADNYPDIIVEHGANFGTAAIAALQMEDVAAGVYSERVAELETALRDAQAQLKAAQEALAYAAEAVGAQTFDMKRIGGYRREVLVRVVGSMLDVADGKPWYTRFRASTTEQVRKRFRDDLARVRGDTKEDT
jgi:hypothetical protein